MNCEFTVQAVKKINIENKNDSKILKWVISQLKNSKDCKAKKTISKPIKDLDYEVVRKSFTKA